MGRITLNMTSCSKISSTDLKIKIEEVLKCPICFEQLKFPKSLNCSHTFCLRCLFQLKNQKECPVCRNPIEKSVQTYKPSKKISDLLKLYNSSLTKNNKNINELKNNEKFEKLVEKFEQLMGCESSVMNEMTETGKKNVTKVKIKNKMNEQGRSSNKEKNKEKGDQKPKAKNSKNSKKCLKGPVKPVKLTNKDKRVYKNELTPDSSRNDSDSDSTSTSEDEGTTKDESITDTTSDDSSTNSSSETTSDTETTSDCSMSDEENTDSSMTTSSLDTNTSTKDTESTFSDKTEEDTKDYKFKINQHVAIFPRNEKCNKKHAIGTVKNKCKVSGIDGHIYGVHLKRGDSNWGLGIKLNKRQVACLDEKCKKWWLKDKTDNLWVHNTRICALKLVADI